MSLSITLLGRNSVSVHPAQRNIRDRRSDRVSRGIRAVEADIENGDLDVLVAATGARGFSEMDGRGEMFGRDARSHLYADGIAPMDLVNNGDLSQFNELIEVFAEQKMANTSDWIKVANG